MHALVFGADCTTYCSNLAGVLKFAELYFPLYPKVRLREAEPAPSRLDKSADTGRIDGDEFY
jgi:hypothetical protein